VMNGAFLRHGIMTASMSLPMQARQFPDASSRAPRVCIQKHHIPRLFCKIFAASLLPDEWFNMVTGHVIPTTHQVPPFSPPSAPHPPGRQPAFCHKRLPGLSHIRNTCHLDKCNQSRGHLIQLFGGYS
jgi:hypothetical protein